MKLSVTILGCGSSVGVPRIGNEWGVCDPEEPKNRRLRCSVLVNLENKGGRTSVLIDTGPDLRQQLLSVDVKKLDAVLYTHPHADHLHGIDDLRSLMVSSKKSIPVFMDANTFERAKSAFGYCFKQGKCTERPPIVQHTLIEPERMITVNGDGGAISFEPIYVQHGDIMALGFRFSGIAYLPDVSSIPNCVLERLKALEYLILDCLRRKPHPSHFNLEKALEVSTILQPKSSIFTNLHDDLDYQTLCRELPAGIIPAYDGMKIEISLLEQYRL
ncbi:MBL fold metallo-hydrolase [Thalassospira lucentensis]|uniref:MBL fold metallo-hydrolase n=1 Tax=Thalassospira lucentensis TaxID=168935 RepID=UPI0003B37F6D|nr:MBL fold metallo-hydrolase [Thalassospira lucentensis]RCK18814.1 PhnP [Thalassospira lucentensis MCCC 1A00383 = DSM 14000]